MSVAFTVFAAAFGLGLIFNAAPGAVFVETLRRGIRGGFRPALAVQLGSLVGDALWGVLGLMGIGLLLRVDVLRVPVGVAGAGYLLWLAWQSWRDADREILLKDEAGHAISSTALWSGILLSITNPQNLAYWAALGSALGVIGVSNPMPGDYVIFFLGFMASSFFWAFFCAALVHVLMARLGWVWVRVTYRVCSVTFLLLALSSLRDLWQSRPRPRAASPTFSNGAK